MIKTSKTTCFWEETASVRLSHWTYLLYVSHFAASISSDFSHGSFKNLTEVKPAAVSSPPSPAPPRPPGSRLLAAVAVFPADLAASVRAGRSSEGTACALRTSGESGPRSSSARSRRRRSTTEESRLVLLQCLMCSCLKTQHKEKGVSPEPAGASPPSERWRPGCQLLLWPTGRSLRWISETHTSDILQSEHNRPQLLLMLQVLKVE